MNSRDCAHIVGIYEHPARKAPDKTIAQLHAEVAAGALADAGLELRDVDAYFCAGDAPGLGAMSVAEYMGLDLNHVDTTEIGGSSYIAHLGHAAQAIAAGKCSVALITLAGRPRSERFSGKAVRVYSPDAPDLPFEFPYHSSLVGTYAMVAARHMHQFGTTSEQLAWIKVAASEHARHNEHAMLRDPVTVADVLASPEIARPLRRLDCCVVSDGGGAVIVARPEIAASLGKPKVALKGAGEAIKHQSGGAIDLTWSAARLSGAKAFEEAAIKPADIKYASIYASFTITVLMQIEDLGFCQKGQGGRFVADGNLISGVGRLPFNTDGGGLCNNHPANRGGITKIIEAVRQLRGEAHPAVQVQDCDLAIVSGIGGSLGTRHGSATAILERLS